MFKCTVNLTGLSPIMFSRYLPADEYPPLKGEKPFAFSKRMWKEKAHIDKDKNVFIPLDMFKSALVHGAQYANIKIKGNATYTKKIKSGLIVENHAPIGKVDDLTPHRFFVVKSNSNSAGIDVINPIMTEWKTQFILVVTDPIISKSVLQEIIDNAGLYIGLGSRRVANGGQFGRFEAKIADWEEL